MGLIRGYNNLKIRNKLVLSFMAAVVFPMLFVGLMLTSTIRHITVQRAEDEATVNVDRIVNRLVETTNTAMKVYYRAVVDRNLEEMVLKQYVSIIDVVDAYNNYTIFSDSIRMSREFAFLHFYVTNPTLLSSGQFIRVTDPIRDNPWYQDTASRPGQVSWEYINTSDNTPIIAQPYSLCLTSLINGYTSRKALGVMVLGLNNNYLHSILAEEPYETIIVNEAGIIIAAKDSSLTSKYLEQMGLGSILNKPMGKYNIDFKGQQSMAIIKNFSPAQNNRFTVISMLPIHQIEKEAVAAGRLGILIMSVSLLSALLMIIAFSNAISKRISKLGQETHRVASGDFDFTPVIDGGDEIAQLSTDMGTMVRSINALIHEVYEVTLQKNRIAFKQKEIELKSLSNQINPHFLFNTLETIRMKAHCNRDEEVADAVKLLGKILRSHLNISNTLVSIASELELVKSYLEIQRFKYGNELKYTIDCEENILSYEVLPLLLQPIVENAVTHGLKRDPSNGIVTIRLSVEADILEILIEDNGIGLGDQALQELISSINCKDDDSGKQIGLRNVQHRIKLYYGEEFGISLANSGSGGMSVRMMLPWKGCVECSG